jgi:patched 1 protein/patched 2 protein
MQVFANNLGSGTKKNIEMIKQTRKSLDNLNSVYFNGTKVLYMYGYPFLFNEQYLHSHHDLYMVVGFAIGTPFNINSHYKNLGLSTINFKLYECI